MILSMLFARKIDAESMPDTPTNRVAQDVNSAYDRHIDVVYRVCFSLMGNRQDAEDAAQSVFIKLMENGKTFSETEHEKAWLIVTARNHCRDMLRKWWRKKVGTLEEWMLETRSHPSLNGELELAEHLRKLPSAHRLLLYLHYYEGYRVAEIAEMLSINVNTVKSQMRNARKRLKLEIGADWDE
ncbi:RNA polymerase sigma factor [Paenibacillus sp. NPDC058071]|uniref:RNA polymerase sigma factor n=1 Tax=Paenibacillus sp. NPDC058071 TaxID=3346326 RepID=UPI0036D8B55F